MIHIAKELLLKLTYLSLWGQDEYGVLEWCGTREEWHKADCYSGDKVSIEDEN